MAIHQPNSSKLWTGYRRATSVRKCRTIGQSSGEVGSGKTQFWLTAPGPILVQSMDKGLEGVVEDILKEMPEKEIYFKEYEWDPSNPDFDQAYAIALRDEIMTDFEFGLEHGRTVLWDKETDIREVIQYAEFGSPTEGNVKDYGKLNQRYFHLLNRAKSVENVNMGFIQSMKDEWMIKENGFNERTGKPKTSFTKTGKRIRAGWERLDEVVMLEMHHRRERGEFFIDIGKCRQQSLDAPIQDTTLPGMTFAELGTFIINGTTVEDWS
jgi:hypothetical protein